ncbi:MAG: hypothetical protein U5L75_01875 [Candidatus Campbellbacteria bacterium]|nr:hypothetical protein [Candidatus Campbellbacteria bacterium]
MTKTSRGFIDYRIIGLSAFVLFFIVAPQTASALSPPPAPKIYIEASLDEGLFTQEQICLDQGCAFVFGPEQSSDFYYIKRAHEQDQEEGLSFFGQVSLEKNFLQIEPPTSLENKDVPLDEAVLVDALDVLIDDDISDIEPILLQAFKEWTGSRYGESLTVAHRESAEGRALKASKNTLVLCNYIEYQREGDWLVTQGSVERSYCYPDHNTIGVFGPPDVSIRHSHFAFYLLTHMHELPIFYLAGFILVLLGVARFIHRRIKRGEFWLFLRPNKTKIIILIVSGIILTYILTTEYMEPGLDDVRYILSTWVIDYLVEIYLLTCVVGYAMYKRRIERVRK